MTQHLRLSLNMFGKLKYTYLFSHSAVWAMRFGEDDHFIFGDRLFYKR